MKVITLLTDFGDFYPGVMKGVILSLSPEARIVDITHDIEPQNVFQGAFLLYNSYRYFRDAVHVAVVDPGVGTERRAVVIESKNYFFVGPDNGILYPSAVEDGIKAVYSIKEEISKLVGELSTTFHGRDIFAPAAAMVANGDYTYFEEFDSGELKELELFDYSIGGNKVRCRVVYVDRFGNIITNLRELKGKRKGFYFRNIEFPFVKTYLDVDVGEPLSLIGSFGTLELSVREGSAADMLGIKRGGEWIELEVL
ncbi:MAG: S-adenosyl-l-methionine hydroxide adenosyltransferase family protein [Archaeoglobus sp.]|uniref:SAM hydrolase/SAM-dependent halogenase family protein n=1 Tax=Archaeoglobus sp. TaxID=1872626 RepID=UPI001D903165|nr:S-adenosyl-l-methionine hydroxide adenosyltransferase family protein [Archaeoglobus sp.]MBO8180230.1 S-adenosyl-l-methionine hydroxide adenosyltransferase family protein [Archaeoglobus sp.]